VLLAHNHYQLPGGEDEVYAAEARLLEERGHRVVRYAVHNDRVRELGTLALAARTIWSRESRAALQEVMRRERPEIVHFHNTLPLISPSAYYGAAVEGVPVVQTLHNYRLACPNALLFRNGAPCRECVGKRFAYPGILHNCYRGSRAATAAVATMTATHAALGTWTRRVARYITPTRFAREIALASGLPPERVAVKPHFVDPDGGAGDGRGGYAIFVGRLSPEKGQHTLLAAWRRLPHPIPLRIVGDGPMSLEIEREAQQSAHVEWLGRRSAMEVMHLLRDAAFLVCPSECYETFGRVVIEAFSAGTPVLCSDIGAIAELVEHGRTGLLFRPGDVDNLATRAAVMVHDPRAANEWRHASRAEFEQKYSAEQNYVALIDIYRQALREVSPPLG
jgi:glycosyltransferase involved in cell wall biosynthesis